MNVKKSYYSWKLTPSLYAWYSSPYVRRLNTWNEQHAYFKQYNIKNSEYIGYNDKVTDNNNFSLFKLNGDSTDHATIVTLYLLHNKMKDYLLFAPNFNGKLLEKQNRNLCLVKVFKWSILWNGDTNVWISRAVFDDLMILMCKFLEKYNGYYTFG